MTHALLTGPPGSGAWLRCASRRGFAMYRAGEPAGAAGRVMTTLAGTHADVRRVIPEGLSIGE